MKAEVIEKMAALVTAAFGLVAALAWNDTVTTIFKDVFGEHSSIGVRLLYAVAVTIIAVAVTIYVGKAAEKAKNLKTPEFNFAKLGIRRVK